MFDLPDAKRVRREELFGSDDDEIVGGVEEEEEEEELRAKLSARLSGLLSIPTSAPPLATPTEGGAAGGEGDEKNKDEPLQFEFKLFSTSAPSTKVILASKEDELLPDADEGAIARERPLSYYIRPELTADERRQFEFAAVSGDDVKRWSGQRAWGLEVPWRVVKIQVPRATYHKLEKALRQLYPSGGESEDGAGMGGVTDGMEGVIGGKTETEGKKKVRPGKRRRIALRVKLAETKRKQEEMKKKQEAQEKERMTKEEHLREKKKRLNREKKLKRRQKEKEKKMMGTKGDGSQQGGSVAGGNNRDEDESMSDGEGDE
ncbi:hypothetical protein QBC46DRAFT_266984 [Diplogelasinospora grovesii]|uniref:Uncharacterized protein n=1 Tax=Diplogelasinospora grovesii TaxID=303347 RepID=A0AAN6N2Q0_9PEZI|nr:hypothetical protein QBC46DRAFT_266984 [Diplogelasinospora grovesii]